MGATPNEIATAKHIVRSTEVDELHAALMFGDPNPSEDDLWKLRVEAGIDENWGLVGEIDDEFHARGLEQF